MPDPDRATLALESIAASLVRIADHLAARTPAPARRSPTPPRPPEPKPYTPVEHLASDRLVAALAARGFTLRHARAPDPADAQLDSVAVYLAKRLDPLRAFYDALKRDLNGHAGFAFALDRVDAAAIGDHCQFAQKLHQLALLKSYWYDRNQRRIRVATSDSPVAIGFLSGGWLERFAVSAAVTAFARHGDVELLTNVVAKGPDGEDVEFDVLVWADGHLFWIEAKSGDFQAAISRYAARRRQLGIAVEHAFLVLVDATPDRAVTLGAMHKLQVVGVADLAPRLASAVRACAQPPAAASPKEVVVNLGEADELW